MITNELLKNKDWILGGSIIDWGENVFPDFDLVVFLYLPKEIRIERLKRREYIRYGNVIYTDLARRNQFGKFLTWATDYDVNSGIANRTLDAHEKWMRILNSSILRLSGDLTTQERISLTLEKFNAS